MDYVRVTDDYRELDNVRIPLKDGVMLAARIWLPQSAFDDSGNFVPVPAVLEYLPYHFRDGTYWRDEVTYPYFARRGYAGVIVDIRGNGDSDGLMSDEYTEEELSDGCAVIDWIAKQAWCDGRVGMIGISWGGFNGLQIAYLQPSALKAVITMCSTDDRYGCDIHYKGGCHLTDNFTWSQQMLSLMSRSPIPHYYGEGWRDEWLKRLDSMPHLVGNWLKHQRRDDFWKRGSVCEDYGKVAIPVWAIGGWQDCYPDTLFNLLGGLEQCKSLGGPWEHMYPNLAHVEPRIDFLGEACDFWDKHLRDGERLDSGGFTAFIEQYTPASRDYGERLGYWVEVSGDSVESHRHVLYLDGSGLRSEANESGQDFIVDSPCHVGGLRKNFCAGMRVDSELAAEQSGDDALSLCFDGEVLDEPLVLLGRVGLSLGVSSDTPQAMIVARLCDIAEDGSSKLISWGCLNLCHRHGSESPEAMPIGKSEVVEFSLIATGYEVARGHRLRLSLSNHYWPMLWPSPTPTRLVIDGRVSCVSLPLLSEHKRVSFAKPSSVDLPHSWVSEPSYWNKSSVKDGEHISEFFDDFGCRFNANSGLEVWCEVYTRFSITEGEPHSARAEVRWRRSISRPSDGWRISSETSGIMHADSDYFYMQASWQAYEGDKRLFDRDISDKIKRDFM